MFAQVLRDRLVQSDYVRRFSGWPAHQRALRLLVAANVLSVDELPAVRRVLTAAALSYAASAVMAMSRVPWLLGRLGR